MVRRRGGSRDRGEEGALLGSGRCCCSKMSRRGGAVRRKSEGGGGRRRSDRDGNCCRRGAPPPRCYPRSAPPRCVQEEVSPSPSGPPVRTRSSYHLSEIFEFNGKKHYTYKVGTAHSRSKLASVVGRGCLPPSSLQFPTDTLCPPPSPFLGGVFPLPLHPLYPSASAPPLLGSSRMQWRASWAAITPPVPP